MRFGPILCRSRAGKKQFTRSAPQPAGIRILQDANPKIVRRYFPWKTTLRIKRNQVVNSESCSASGEQTSVGKAEIAADAAAEAADSPNTVVRF